MFGFIVKTVSAGILGLLDWDSLLTLEGTTNPLGGVVLGYKSG